jgi:hypothetical protein
MKIMAVPHHADIELTPSDPLDRKIGGLCPSKMLSTSRRRAAEVDEGPVPMRVGNSYFS